MFTQFSSIEPDPLARAQLVNAFLQANGIDQNAALSSGYLPNQVTEERRQEASVALLGARSTLIFNIYQTRARALTDTVTPGSQFANGNVVNWLGYNVTWAHRLTQLSTLNLSAYQTRTSESIGSDRTNLWTLNVMWSRKLAERIALSVSANYTDFSSTISPYTEAGLQANLNLAF